MYLPLFVNNYIQCKNCSYVLNTIDRMKIGDVDKDIRNPNVDEDIEIYTFTLINKFPDDVDVLDRIFDGGGVEDRHINMIKRLFYEAFDEYTLYLSEVDFQYPILDVNFNLNVGELKRILNWIGWFHKPIGNSIYNKTTIDKIKRRIEDNVLRRL